MKKEYKDNYGGIEEDLSLKSIGVYFVVCLTCGLAPIIVMFL